MMTQKKESLPDGRRITGFTASVTSRQTSLSLVTARASIK